MEPILLTSVLSVSPSDCRGREQDQLLFDWEGRKRLRRRMRTRKSREVFLALPTGTKLSGGEILWLAPTFYIQVELKPELLLFVLPSTEEEKIALAHEVGNRHFPLGLQEEVLVLLDDPVMLDLLRRRGVPFQQRRAIFHPLQEAAAHGDFRSPLPASAQR